MKIARILGFDWLLLKEIGDRTLVFAKTVMYKGYFDDSTNVYGESKLKLFLDDTFTKKLSASGFDCLQLVNGVWPLTVGQYNIYIKEKFPASDMPWLLRSGGTQEGRVFAVDENGELIEVQINEPCGIRPAFMVDTEYIRQFIVSEIEEEPVPQTPTINQNNSAETKEHEQSENVQTAQENDKVPTEINTTHLTAESHKEEPLQPISDAPPCDGKAQISNFDEKESDAIECLKNEKNFETAIDEQDSDEKPENENIEGGVSSESAKTNKRRKRRRRKKKKKISPDETASLNEVIKEVNDEFSLEAFEEVSDENANEKNGFSDSDESAKNDSATTYPLEYTENEKDEMNNQEQCSETYQQDVINCDADTQDIDKNAEVFHIEPTLHVDENVTKENGEEKTENTNDIKIDDTAQRKNANKEKQESFFSRLLKKKEKPKQNNVEVREKPAPSLAKKEPDQSERPIIAHKETKYTKLDTFRQTNETLKAGQNAIRSRMGVSAIETEEEAQQASSMADVVEFYINSQLPPPKQHGGAQKQKQESQNKKASYSFTKEEMLHEIAQLKATIIKNNQQITSLKIALIETNAESEALMETVDRLMKEHKAKEAEWMIKLHDAQAQKQVSDE